MEWYKIAKAIPSTVTFKMQKMPLTAYWYSSQGCCTPSALQALGQLNSRLQLPSKQLEVNSEEAKRTKSASQLQNIGFVIYSQSVFEKKIEKGTL
jgi:hypothetical protein